ncbi:MAG: T9SS type A sorting domain-containing protein [Ignavibacteria bacterium]|nr:T9SS type A sorting domain-containing protein [Ignavibacteria bacterium]
MKKLIVSILFTLFAAIQIYSQPSLERLDAIDHGTGTYEWFRDIYVDANGFTYVTGETDSSNAVSGLNIITIKYNPDFTKAWVKHFDFANMGDRCDLIRVDAAGNVYVIGWVGVTSSNSDIIVIKYRPNGILEWSQRLIAAGYSGLRADYPTDAVIQGGFLYVIGAATENTTTYTDGVLFKVSATGTYSSVTLGTTGISEKFEGIAMDPADNVYVTGSGNNYLRGLAAKYNSSLRLLWSKEIIDTTRRRTALFNIILNSAGGVIINGVATGTGYISITNLMMLNPATGALMGYKRFNCPATPYVLKLIKDNAGNIIYSGYVDAGGSSQRGLIVKYNSSGVFQWSKVLDTLRMVSDIESDSYGNIYPVARYGLGNKYFAKYDASGNFKWYGSFRYADGVRSFFKGGKLYIAGSVNRVTGNSVMFVARYALPSGEIIPTGEIIDESNSFRLEENYPNPFNPSTTIRFSVPFDGMTTLKVYDIAGREVASLIESNMEAGMHEVVFNASNLSSGVYVYKLSSGSYTDVKKMILVK